MLPSITKGKHAVLAMIFAEVQRVVHSVVENPHIGTVVRQPIRRSLLRGFPFGILYRVDAHEIVINAVMHLRRRPGYWTDRV